MTVLGRERQHDARVGDDLVVAADAFGHVTLHVHAFAKLLVGGCLLETATGAFVVEHLVHKLVKRHLVGIISVLGQVSLARPMATAEFTPNSSATSSTKPVVVSNSSLLEASLEHCSRPSGMSQRSSPAIWRGLSTNCTAIVRAFTSANDVIFCEGFGKMA